MRDLKYLSPTSISKFYDNIKNFYMIYLSDNRMPREAQTKPMSIGSSFDAYVKAYLHNIFVKDGDERFAFETLFEAQVEEHNRDWALRNGKYLFDCYKASGALADLQYELHKASSKIVFEVDLQGKVRDTPTSPGAVLLGKPDIYYIGDDGTPIILDWKVNGYCSNSAVSPKKGHVGIRHGTDASKNKAHHRDAILAHKGGICYNAAQPLDGVDDKWARQLSVYAWLCGAKVGQEFIVGIDQVCCKPTNTTYPEVRFARHRSLVSLESQRRYYKEAEYLWMVVHSNHIFRDLPIEESQALQRQLDAIDHTDEEFNRLTRGGMWG